MSEPLDYEDPRSVRITLLGGLRIEANGDALSAPTGRYARTLLVWLALHHGVHSRSRVAAILRPDGDEPAARHALRQAVWGLRSMLGEAHRDLIESHRGGIGIRDGDVAVDITLLRARAIAGSIEAANAIAANVLVPDLDEDWLVALRHEITAEIAAGCARSCREAEAAGELQLALQWAKTRTRLDPLSEAAHRDVIHLLDATGDRASALKVAGEMRETLRESLGVVPSSTTREVVQRILDEPVAPDVVSAAALSAAPKDGPGAARPPLPPVFARVRGAGIVGRDRERALLVSALDTVRGGAQQNVLVSGEPGIGKSTLAGEVAREAHSSGALVLVGRCHEEPLAPFAPFVEALHALGELHPEPAADAGAARLRLFDEVHALVAAAALDQPVMLILEDIHWADPGTLRLLAHLATAPEPSRLLLLGTFRHTELGRRHPLAAVLADLRRDPRTQRLHLEGLDEAATGRLLSRWVEREPNAAFVRRIVADTGGNPFFIEELLRDRAEQGALDPSGKPLGDGDHVVPESVREVIEWRVGRLSDAAVAALEYAAVAGREFDLQVLGAGGGLAQDALLDGLEEAERAHLVRPDGGARWAFGHALVREAVYESQPMMRRARLHAAVMQGLLESGDAVAEAAFHAFQAVVVVGADRVVSLARAAATEALQGLAYEQAAGHLARALQTLDSARKGDPGVRLAMLLDRGDALARAADPEALAVFAQARALAREAGDAERLARAALGACGVGVSIIDVDPERLALLEEALDAMGERDPVLSSELLARLAVELYYAPTRDRSEALSAEAVTVARSARAPRAVAAALNSRHVALWRPDRLDERLRAADEMLEAARAAGDRALQLQARNWRVVDLFELGDMRAWRVEVRRHGALAEELRLPSFTWYSPLWAAVDALHCGRFEEGRAMRQRALVEGRRAGDRNAPLFAQLLEIDEAVARGDFASIDLKLYEERIASSPARVAWRCGYSWILAELGRLDEAAGHLLALSGEGFAALPFDANWLSAVGFCAEACAILREPRCARQLYELLAPYAGRPLTAGRAISTYGACDRHLGGLAAALGRLDDAVDHYEDAIRLNCGAGLRPWVLRAQRGLVTVLLARGDDERAHELEATVAAEARDLGIANGAPPPA